MPIAKVYRNQRNFTPATTILGYNIIQDDENFNNYMKSLNQTVGYTVSGYSRITVNGVAYYGLLRCHLNYKSGVKIYVHFVGKSQSGSTYRLPWTYLMDYIYSANLCVTDEGLLLANDGTNGYEWHLVKINVSGDNVGYTQTIPLRDSGNTVYTVYNRTIGSFACVNPDEMRLYGRVVYYDPYTKNYAYALLDVNTFSFYDKQKRLCGIIFHTYHYLGEQSSGGTLNVYYLHTAHGTSYDVSEYNLPERGFDAKIISGSANKLYLINLSFWTDSIAIMEANNSNGMFSSGQACWDATIGELDTKYITNNYETELMVKQFGRGQFQYGGQTYYYIVGYETKGNEYLKTANGVQKKIEAKAVLYRCSDAGIYRDDYPYIFIDTSIGGDGIKQWSGDLVLVEDKLYLVGFGSLYKCDIDSFVSNQYVGDLSIANFAYERQLTGMDSALIECSGDVRQGDKIVLMEGSQTIGTYFVQSVNEMFFVGDRRFLVRCLDYQTEKLSRQSDRYTEFSSLNCNSAQGGKLPTVLSMTGPIVEKSDVSCSLQAKVSFTDENWEIDTVDSGKPIILKLRGRFDTNALYFMIRQKYGYRHDSLIRNGMIIFLSNPSNDMVKLKMGLYDGTYFFKSIGYSWSSYEEWVPNSILNKGIIELLCIQRESEVWICTRNTEDNASLYWKPFCKFWLNPYYTRDATVAPTRDVRARIGIIGSTGNEFNALYELPVSLYLPSYKDTLTEWGLATGSYLNNSTYVLRSTKVTILSYNGQNYCYVFPLPCTDMLYWSYQLFGKNLYIKYNGKYYRILIKDHCNCDFPLTNISMIQEQNIGEMRIIPGYKYVKYAENVYRKYFLATIYETPYLAKNPPDSTSGLINFAHTQPNLHPQIDQTSNQLRTYFRIYGYNNYSGKMAEVAGVLGPKYAYGYNYYLQLPPDQQQSYNPGSLYYVSAAVYTPLELPAEANPSVGIEYNKIELYPTYFFYKDHGGPFFGNDEVPIYLPKYTPIYERVEANTETSATISSAETIAGDTVYGVIDILKELCLLAGADSDFSDFSAVATLDLTANIPHNSFFLRASTARLKYLFDSTNIPTYAAITNLDKRYSLGVIHYLKGQLTEYGFAVVPRYYSPVSGESSRIVFCLFEYEKTQSSTELVLREVIDAYYQGIKMPAYQYDITSKSITIRIGQNWEYTFTHPELVESTSEISLISPFSRYNLSNVKVEMVDIVGVVELSWIDVGESYLKKILSIISGLDIGYRIVNNKIVFFRPSKVVSSSATLKPYNYMISSSIPSLSGRVLVDGIIYAEFIDPELVSKYGNNYTRLMNTVSNNAVDLVREVELLRKNFEEGRRRVSIVCLDASNSNILPGQIITAQVDNKQLLIRVTSVNYKSMIGNNTITINGVLL